MFILFVCLIFWLKNIIDLFGYFLKLLELMHSFDT